MSYPGMGLTVPVRTATWSAVRTRMRSQCGIFVSFGPRFGEGALTGHPGRTGPAAPYGKLKTFDGMPIARLAARTHSMKTVPSSWEAVAR